MSVTNDTFYVEDTLNLENTLIACVKIELNKLKDTHSDIFPKNLIKNFFE